MVHVRRAGKTVIVSCLALLFLGPVSAEVVINEIMYNPPSDQGNDSYFEWIELWNAGEGSVDLSDWTLTDGEGAFVMDSGTILQSKHFAVIARKPDSLLDEPEYADNLGDGDDILLGPATFSLSNTADEMVLVDPLGTTVDSVHYQDGPEEDWPTGADGEGPSLELLRPTLDNNVGTSWSSSTDSLGTPGDTNSTFSSSVLEGGRGEQTAPRTLWVSYEGRDRKPVIRLSLREDATVSADLFDLRGRKVDEIYNGTAGAGDHRFPVREGLPSGMYLLLFSLDERRTGTKVLLMN
jgi:hypothetical protein